MVSEKGAEGSLDDLMLGNVSEDVSESDEQIQVRMAAALAKLKKIQKDESFAKDFDSKLAKIIPNLSQEVLKFVIFMIDRDVPSLTILAMISIANNEAGKICYAEFHKFIEESADFSPVKFTPEVEQKVSLWWTFILGADHVSTTTKLSEFKGKADFSEFVSQNFSKMLGAFLAQNQVEGFDEEVLKKLLEEHEDMLFEGIK